MEQKRKLSDLLIALSCYIEKETTFRGMCTTISDMYFFYEMLTSDEFNVLENYITENKPTNLYTIRSNDAYYWTRGNKTPRLRWLRRHAKKQQKLNN